MDIDEIAWEEAAERHDHALELLAVDRVPEAEVEAQAAAAALAEAVGSEHPDAVNALVTLAEIGMRRGQLQEGVDQLEEALRRLIPWRDEPAVAPIRGRATLLLAEALVRLGRYEPAEAALATLGAELGPEDPLRGELDNLRGISAKFQGRWEVAQHFYQRALAVPGVDRALIFHNLSGLASSSGDFPAAERWSRAALKAQRSRRTRRYGMDLAGLGDALAGQGRPGEALRCYRRAIGIFQTHDPEDPEIAYALHNQGDALAALGRRKEAEVAYLESLTRKTRVFGAAHPEIAGSLANLAALYHDQGRLPEAKQRLTAALSMVASLEPSHPVRAGVEALARSWTD